MGYQLYQIKGGPNPWPPFVLLGNGPHDGTMESVSYADAMANAGTEQELARYLDFRFLRAHGERVKRDLDAQEIEAQSDETPKAVQPEG